MTVAYLVWVRPFLTANWRYLAMLNFVVDPKIVAPLVPPGTELDFENGETFLSVVGFLFLDTRLLGLPIPLHRDFEEVNLRFYVRKKSADTWRRGVVLKHEIEHVDPKLKVEYSWRRGCKWESLKMSASGEPQAIAAGSHAEFITEHYWGYTRVRAGCSEYQVEHPRWKIWNANDFEFRGDTAALYGPQFVETLSAPPRSAFIAEGSPITIEGRSILL